MLMQLSVICCAHFTLRKASPAHVRDCAHTPFSSAECVYIPTVHLSDRYSRHARIFLFFSLLAPYRNPSLRQFPRMALCKKKRQRQNEPAWPPHRITSEPRCCSSPRPWVAPAVLIQPTDSIGLSLSLALSLSLSASLLTPPPLPPPRFSSLSLSPRCPVTPVTNYLFSYFGGANKGKTVGGG